MAEDAKSSQPGGWLRRLNFTPMRDLIRGRLSSLYDFYGQFFSVFPKPLAKHLLRIVRRTRLDMREQVDVTQELIERCRQLIESGKSPGDIILELDKKKTSRSLRRRYRLQRGCIRRAFDRTVFVIAMLPLAFIALYACAMVFFWFSHPTLTVDYLAQLNEPANAVPEQDRAWPGYRQAMLILHRHDETNPEPQMDGMSPYQSRWPEMVAYLQDHRDTLVLVREAASKPGLGLTVGYPGYYRGDDAMVIYGPSENGPSLPREVEVGDWHHIQKPMTTWMWRSEIGPLGRLSRLVVSDAYLAVEERDPDRFCDDITAMFGMARHAVETPTINNGIWGISIRGLACEVISDVLVTNPGVFQDKHLKKLIEVLEYDAGDSLISIEGSRIMTMDLIQRIYTDNGKGGGRLTPEGVCLLSHQWGWDETKFNPTIDRLNHTIRTPACAVMTVSRRAMEDKVESLFQIHKQEISIPMWRQPISAADVEFNSRTVLGRFRYGPVNLIAWYSGIREIIALGEAKRSGVLAGIALERYRRDLGVWPDSLNELLPNYLAEVPVDPITGEPARYQIIDGWPVVYSVGGDRDDDEGRLPVSRGYDDEEYDSLPSAQTWDIKNAGDGDWILYPYPDTLRKCEPNVELPD